MFLAALSFLIAAEVTPLTRGHAHNDYEHSRPLLEALDNGFTSIEADIFLVDGKLLVGHNRTDLKPERTLEKMYLDPLLKRVQANKGSVYAEKAPVILLVDIKAEGSEVYKRLKQVLPSYSEMLSDTGDKGIVNLTGERGLRQHAVTIILSGDYPFEDVKADKERMVFLDGKLDQPETFKDADLAPLVSGNWTDHMRWDGKGVMPASQEAKLHLMADDIHRRHQKLRLWGAPDNENTWHEVYLAGVDLINTDHLGELRKYLLSTGKP